VPTVELAEQRLEIKTIPGLLDWSAVFLHTS
jgi:hypothetical protein